MAPQTRLDGAMPTLSKRARILLAVLIALALGGGGGFYLFRVRPQGVGTLTLYGNVDIREVHPAFNSSGHIIAIYVQEGAVVKKGQLLAVLDDTRYAAALAQAKETMEAARVTYANNEVNYRRLDKFDHRKTRMPSPTRWDSPA